MWKKKQAGPAYSEFTGFHRGETPEAQSNTYKSGCSAMGISAKHNSGVQESEKAIDSEPMQYK